MTMTTTNQTTVEADPKLPTIKIVREFEAPRDRVYRAWTEPDLVAQWMGTEGHADPNRPLGPADRRQLSVRIGPRRRGDRGVLRVVPRGTPQRAAGADVHLRRRP
jgi:uncharacterized protein YndB with AHSA1/START domain